MSCLVLRIANCGIYRSLIIFRILKTSMLIAAWDSCQSGFGLWFLIIRV